MSLAKVLLVDDEVPFVEAMVRRLTKRDLEIFTAHSGQEGLDMLAEHPSTDVVILDVKMPVWTASPRSRRSKADFPWWR
jgi:CheY-like chemotaxis protein